MLENRKTFFDSPERSPLEQVLVEHEEIKMHPIVQQMLEGFPEFAILINEQRQVVAYNSKWNNLLTIESLIGIIGLRVGQIFNCIHKDDEPSGCGTTKFCTQCGAAKAMKFTREKLSSHVEECRISSRVENDESSHNLLIHTTPLHFMGRNYTLFAIRDISQEKRREELERIFFHDVLNTSGAVRGIATLLKDEKDIDEQSELMNSLILCTDQLVNEILSQRDLRYAEEGELNTDYRLIKVNSILSIAFKTYYSHELAVDKNYNVEYLDTDIEIETDPSLLIRSLGNLVKNALEASAKGDEIKIFATQDENYIGFNVYNSKVIPSDVQMQIFQRSFSTKSEKGRGIGTYSIKLITERYLGGQVSFVSDKETNTVFTIKLPRILS